ncbi:hypothetical protein CTEN210_18392 [Chaetoceros tenuissimus]|uniref:Uncharacterized protein n=1 Tax=Chaetoceros tenuissimus TaxID=426638 RepID=A0AAD3DCR7_9STRA|nr:hypothetical protein CTEN210_18392 [Chaetoceros tenuissimus]
MRLTTAISGLSKSENADLEEACKKLETRVEDFRGKKTLFWNGEKLQLDEDFSLIYNKEERQTWEVIIVLPGVEVIPNYTFYYCENVKTVIMADTVKRIEERAFYHCMSLKFVKFSRNLEYIGAFAFCDCNSLTSIFIPPSCREIGRRAFDTCLKLMILHVSENTLLGKQLISNTWLGRCFYHSGNKTIKKYAYIERYIKNRHNELPLHKLSCSEHPTFDTKTVVKCLTKDECGCTPFMYLICNHTTDFDLIQKIVQFGGKELLMIEDKNGWNCLHYACRISDIAIQKLLVKKGGQELADTLLKVDEFDFKECRSSDVIQSALLIHTYMNTIKSTKDHGIAETAILEKLLQSKPSYADIHEIIHEEEIHNHIPPQHLISLKEYNQAILDQELQSLHDTHEKVPLMRSTIAVVGRGRDGKTCTINSLKGLPFQPYCESTKGSKTSEVNVHEIGIHVTSVEASGVAFEEAKRDPLSTLRSVSSHLMNSSRERRYLNVVQNSSLESSTLNESGSIDEITKRLERQTLDSDISIGKESTLEEDIATKVDNIDLATSKDGKSIRFTIFDNGGQRVFRSIQNLLLSREGIFIVVFDIMKIFDENSREEALEHLEYWLSSIKMDAFKTDTDESSDPSIKYPPVILVGTHYDEFLKLKGDTNKGLQAVNLPLSGLIPIPNHSNDFPLLDRQQLYNEAQNLCFWPVDNSDPNDVNIQAIRSILMESAMGDPGFDISQEVPISFLRAMDKLTAMSEEVPVLPINSNDPHEPSVLQIMEECGVYDNVINDERQKLELCRAIMKQYQSIGHFIFFDQVGLQDYCILDPQWLINIMTYVIRDFAYHWFPRDKRAIKLNNGLSWKRLKDDCILDMPLLRQLWLGYDEHFEFLTNVMIEIGIFGKCNGFFTIPILRASENSDESLREKFSNHNEIGSIQMGKHGFALVPFYSRLVNSLVDDKREPPVILPSACFFRFELKLDMFALWLNHEEKKVLIYSNGDKSARDRIFSLVHEKTFNLNSAFYKNQLDFKLNKSKFDEALKVDVDAICRSTLQRAEDIFRNDPPATKEQNQRNTDYDERVLSDLVTLLKLKFKAKTAKTIAETMMGANEDVTIYSLRNFYFKYDEKTFKDEILKDELGITKLLHRDEIVEAIKTRFRDSIISETIMVACMESEEGFKMTPEIIFDREENMIKYMLAQSNYAALVLKPNAGFFNKNLLDSSSRYKFLHFGAHGKTTGKNSAYIGILKDDDRKNQFECLVLNTCKSAKVLDIAETEFKNKFIIYWDSSVTHEAAIRFCEQFYGYYCAEGTRANPISFEKALRKAEESMKQHNFVFEDPGKNANRNDGKVSAGILKFHSGGTGEVPMMVDDGGKDIETSYGMNPSIVSPNNDSNGRNRKNAKKDSNTNTTFGQSNNTSSSDIENTSSSRKRSRNGDAVPMAHGQELSGENQNRSAGENVPNSPRECIEGKKGTCKLRCSYLFTTCRHRIQNANCKFIEYKNEKNCSLDQIKDIRNRGGRSIETICDKCKRNYCSKKTIPTGSSFVSCFDVHNCDIGDKEVDFEVELYRTCGDFTLSKTKSGTFYHCEKCTEVRMKRTAEVEEWKEALVGQSNDCKEALDSPSVAQANDCKEDLDSFKLSDEWMDDISKQQNKNAFFTDVR